ncbi:hypothetical protein CVU75_02645, partial [Candidatus Dependentiae bacterium HGW-Dependentiae-1]
MGVMVCQLRRIGSAVLVVSVFLGIVSANLYAKNSADVRAKSITKIASGTKASSGAKISPVKNTAPALSDEQAAKLIAPLATARAVRALTEKTIGQE